MSETYEAELEVANQAAVAINIKDKKTLLQATTFLLSLNDLKKEIIEFFRPMKEQAYKAHKVVCDKEREQTDIVNAAKGTIDQKILAYRSEESRREYEEFKKIEAVRQAEEDRQRKEIEENIGKEMLAGNVEEVDRLLVEKQDLYVPPDIKEANINKIEHLENGTVSFVKDWQIDIVDTMIIIKAIASGKLPITFIDIKVGEIKKWARANAIDNYNKYGLRLSAKESTRIRGK